MDADFPLKKSVLENGLYDRFVHAKKLCFRGQHEELGLFFAQNDYKISRVCMNLYISNYKKYKKVRDRFAAMLAFGKCYFLTLTFKPSCFESMSFETRRQHVFRFLKSLSPYYVANVDFGSGKPYQDRHGVMRDGTEREHYHCLVVLEDYKPHSWPYGLDWFLVVPNTDKDTKRLSKYLTKLSRHALKDSTKAGRLIFSRKIPGVGETIGKDRIVSFPDWLLDVE
jgi:hypothetical protein